jgi:hypothetical protein
VSTNRELGTIFGLTRQEVTKKWRRLYKEELYDLNSSPNIMPVIKSKMMSKACSTHGRQMRCTQGSFFGKWET